MPKEIPAAATFFSKARSPTYVGAVPLQSQNFRPLFLLPLQQTMPALYQPHPRPVVSGDRGVQMATVAQAPAAPTATDPVQRWLDRRSACLQHDANQIDAKITGAPAPSMPATDSKA